MLQELSIRNFAIIEDITIRFEPGLTILSGETGAGKSIIINAVNLLLGSRVSPGLIRSGADSAELEVLFHIKAGSPAANTMTAMGYDPADGLVVRRLISRKERHRIYINGRLATGQVLTAVTANLASISGQHAHQGLLKEEQHVFILDQFGGLLETRAAYTECHGTVLALIEKERELLRRQARKHEQMELLRFQYDEITKAQIAHDEDAALEREQARLKNAQHLYQTVQTAIGHLYRDEGAVVERLGQLAKQFETAARIDEALEPRASEMESAMYAIEDSVASLRDYLGRLSTDPNQLETVEARLDQLNRLKRKYGGTLDDVLRHATDAQHQLDAMESLDAAIAAVRQELAQGHTALCDLAVRLSRKRTDVASALSEKVEAELAALKMTNTQFAVQVSPLETGSNASPHLMCEGRHMGETGMDHVTFMMAPNVGEPIKPLAAIASGGELSRVVLALKAILARNDALETVVFDEVDAGIGGGVAEVVGQKLADLANHHQILCITHLPQIAKFGAHHYRISKAVSGGRTRTSILPLNADERVAEIARMLGGEKITALTLDHAKEMLRAPS